MRLIDADDVLRGIEELKKSPWYNAGKWIKPDPFAHVGFLARREAIQVVVDLCIKDALTIEISNFNNRQPTNDAAQEGKKSGWISVEDRLPEEPGSYLCWFGKNMLSPGMSVASYIPKLHGFGSLEYYKVYENVTHWMPLPEAPEQIN